MNLVESSRFISSFLIGLSIVARARQRRVSRPSKMQIYLLSILDITCVNAVFLTYYFFIFKHMAVKITARNYNSSGKKLSLFLLDVLNLQFLNTTGLKREIQLLLKRFLHSSISSLICSWLMPGRASGHQNSLQYPRIDNCLMVTDPQVVEVGCLPWGKHPTLA